MKRVKNWLVGVGVLAAFTVAGALSESDLRTALEKWMQGSPTIQNPFAEVLNYFDDSRIVATAGWDPASCATNFSVTTSIAVTGAEVGDPVVVSHESVGNQTGLLLSGRATNDLVYVTLYNNGGVAFDCPTGLVKVIVFKY